MSNSSILHPLRTLARRSRRDRSLDELALVLPLLLFLFLAVFDFGRLFAAAVTRNEHAGHCCPESRINS